MSKQESAIPVEAVEAAAKAYYGAMTGGGSSEWGYLDKQSQDNRLCWMQSALAAAAPYMHPLFDRGGSLGPGVVVVTNESAAAIVLEVQE